MAVHPQKPLSDFAFDPGLRTRSSAATIDLDHHQRQLRLVPASQANLGMIPNTFEATVFADGRQSSELTSNGTSASRKRARGDDPSHHHRLDGVWKIQNQIASAYDGRVDNSTMTSTSERSTCSVDVPGCGGDDLISCLYRQSLEVDALIRVQSEQLRSQLEEASRRQYRAVISAMERQMQRRLAEKESELQRVKRRHAELEEKLTQVVAENQLWFSVARKNEATVANLRSNLEQALIQQNEGFGETDDASCCFADDHHHRPRMDPSPACKACGGTAEEVCVLLLPCRHLCLCKTCESKTDACPICHTPRNASVQVFT